MLGQLRGPGQHGLPSRRIVEIPVRQFFKEILEVRLGIEAIFLGGFDDTVLHSPLPRAGYS